VYWALCGRRDLAGSKQTPGRSVLGRAGPSRSCGIEEELRGGVVGKVPAFKPGDIVEFLPKSW